MKGSGVAADIAGRPSGASATPGPERTPHAMRMNEIQEQIDRGDYRVDHHAVADAILRRLLAAGPRSSPEASRS